MTATEQPDLRRWPLPPCARRGVPDVLRDAHTTADWRQTAALYQQCSHILQDSEATYLPDELPGALAGAIFAISATYQGHEDKLAEHALAIFAEAEGEESEESFDAKLFQSLYGDSRFGRFPAYINVPGVRRRPTPFEAVVETSRRLRDATNLKQVLTRAGTSGSIGGSTSYGPFFNVRGATVTTASDLDLIVVLQDSRDLLEIGEQLRHLPGVDKAGLETFVRRARIFGGRYDDQKTVLSHKLGIWTDCTDPMMEWANWRHDYLLSLHFLTLPVLDYVLVEPCTRLTRDTAGARRSVWDYRDTDTTRQEQQCTFAGRNHVIAIQSEAAEEGYRRRSPVYYLDDDDSYCPGVFQNLLLPRLETHWDELDIQPRLAKFKNRIVERLRYERCERPHAYLRLSLSHTRRQVFAPHVIHHLDETPT